MEIRRMQISDYEPVYALWFNTSGIGVTSDSDSRDGVKRILDRNPDTCLVAVDGIDIAGIILCGNDGRRGYIYHLAVLEEFRNRGIGRLLVEAVIKELVNQKVNGVSLVAFKGNDPGNKFWESMGFSDRSDLKFWDRHLNIDDVWLNKDVTFR